ncbi:MAG: DegT/DnrJ/EryC1/StrS aminotransferase family protein [Spirochaetales bacterium]|nr:DegT/DnrJ/EryC1/StrS aminotransferase family protein [Spirochaetales bacterium]
MDGVLQTMVNEKIGPGERALAFVQAFCAQTGSSSACAFRTYPDALECALRTAGVAQGSLVAVSPLSPSEYRDAIQKTGARMVMVDIDRETGCPDERLVQESGAQVLMLYENKGTLPVRYNEETTFAECCDYGEITIIEDISESIGSAVGEEFSAGKLGQIVVCAVEEDSVVSAAGGSVVAASGDFSTVLRENRPSKYLRMPDLNAALGTVQLLNMQENMARRRDITATYKQSLGRTRHRQFGLNLMDFSSNASAFSVFLDCRPEEVVKFAQKNGVPVRQSFENCLLRDYEGDAFESFPAAAPYYFRTVDFPLYPFLKASEVDMISKVIAHLP